MWKGCRWFGWQRSSCRKLWNTLLHFEHPQVTATFAGCQMRYLVASDHGVLGALGFSSSAFQLGARDAWIGWSAAQRQAHLHRVVCLSRFLIRPGLRCRNLASHVSASISGTGGSKTCSGCSSPAARWKTPPSAPRCRLQRAAIIDAVIAWRIMLMTLLDREVPECPAELMFTDSEIHFLEDYANNFGLGTPGTWAPPSSSSQSSEGTRTENTIPRPETRSCDAGSND